MTAKTAERMVCPMGMEDGEGQSTCYGPECMAWRWYDWTPPMGGERRGYCGVDHPETLYRRGYCGMAGKAGVE